VHTPARLARHGGAHGGGGRCASPGDWARRVCGCVTHAAARGAARARRGVGSISGSGVGAQQRVGALRAGDANLFIVGRQRVRVAALPDVQDAPFGALDAGRAGRGGARARRNSALRLPAPLLCRCEVALDPRAF
jgi:hypothetical protein